MLGSHCMFLSIDSEIHRPIKDCRLASAKEPLINKFDDSLVDEVDMSHF